MVREKRRIWETATAGNENRTAGAISTLYALFGSAWMLLADHYTANVATTSLDTANRLHGLYTGTFLFITTLWLYLALRLHGRRTEQARQQLILKNEQLRSTFEELGAAEQGLWRQHDELKVLSQALRDRDDDLSALFQHMHDAFAVVAMVYDEQHRSVDYRYLEVNAAYENLAGISREKLVGKRALEVMPGTEDYWIETFGRVALTGIPASVENYAAGLQRYLSVMAYSLQQGRVAMLVADVTEEKEREEVMHRLAYYDGLTGLPNRMLFVERMKVALAHCRRLEETLTILYLDLDNFKRVNDALGHGAGDQLLKEIAARLVASVQAEAVIARMGGDEFSLILPGDQEAEAVAQRIIAAVKEPWAYQDHEFHVAASVGVAMYPNDGESVEELLKSADAAMYDAKTSGKNTYRFFSQNLHDAFLRRVALENDLHHAVENNELVVYFQPIIQADGAIFGVEALVRWQHPSRGLLYPDSFIHIAEDTGLIIGIGEWMLRAACEQIMLIQERTGKELHLAVNLSAKQFLDGKLGVMVERVLEETGLPAPRLELEITESVAMADAEISYSIMKELRRLGISLALDDFGTGYSSLRYLKQFPIDTIKIDKSFVRDVNSDVEDQAIIQAIIGLADTLKLNVIAEGVETEEHRRYLQNVACGQMQGYLFSRPAPIAALEAWLAKYNGNP